MELQMIDLIPVLVAGAVFLIALFVYNGRNPTDKKNPAYKKNSADNNNRRTKVKPDNSAHGMSAASDWDRYRMAEPQEPKPKKDHPEWDGFRMN